MISLRRAVLTAALIASIPFAAFALETPKTSKDVDAAANWLAAFVLLDWADQGIAQDYAAYRQMHHEVLAPYINEIWFPDKPSK